MTDIEERAAILEHDADLTESEATELAYKLYDLVVAALASDAPNRFDALADEWKRGFRDTMERRKK